MFNEYVSPAIFIAGHFFATKAVALEKESHATQLPRLRIFYGTHHYAAVIYFSEKKVGITFLV